MLADRMKMSAAIPDLTFGTVVSVVKTANQSIYTSTDHALGTAAGNRKIVVCVKAASASPAPQISSMTVGGVSASLAVAVTSTNGEHRSEIWIASVPTGTTGDIVVNLNKASFECGITAVPMYTAATAAYATDTDAPSIAIMAGTLDIPKGGGAIALSGSGNDATNSWSGLTERTDETVESPNTQSVAFDAFAAEQTALAIQTVRSAGTTNGALVMASWGKS